MFLLPGGYKVWFHQLFDINLMHGGTLGLYGVHVVTTGQQIGFCMCKRSTQKAISMLHASRFCISIFSWPSFIPTSRTHLNAENYRTELIELILP